DIPGFAVSAKLNDLCVTGWHVAELAQIPDRVHTAILRPQRGTLTELVGHPRLIGTTETGLLRCPDTLRSEVGPYLRSSTRREQVHPASDPIFFAPRLDRAPVDEILV